MAIEPVSLWNASTAGPASNPGYPYQFPPPEGTAHIADYVKAGWDRADVQDYLNAYHATFTAPTMLTYLRIRGTPEYWASSTADLGGARRPQDRRRRRSTTARPPGRRSPTASAGGKQLKDYQAAHRLRLPGSG